MMVGTASDVGKSILTTGLCRILKQDGFSPAPFKAQNMSLNSYATPDGYEIGRAQAVQAEASGIPCHTDMNPVLLKPTSEKSSQVILHGKPVGTQSAKEYFMENNRANLFSEACSAFDRLREKYNPIVMEGAGSISELNLKKRDITNMRMAAYAGAATYLVADIDKGGVFGSLYGTMELLGEAERNLIKGIIINKFRGDATLFQEGKKILEDLCQVPVIGVIPYFNNIIVDEEDSSGLGRKKIKAKEGEFNIAVVRLRHLSNHTDFTLPEKDSRVNLFYSDIPEELEKADVIILPGSKNTIDDLNFLRHQGIDKVIHHSLNKNKKVIGICGGFQMLGEVIEDPWQVEGLQKSVKGLGILPVHTIITREKKTVQTNFYFKDHEELCHGYEIHMGISTITGEISPLNVLEDGHHDGYWLNDRCWGTYMHGILDNACVFEKLLPEKLKSEDGSTLDIAGFKNQQYDLLADHLRQHLDIHYIYRQSGLV